jgi:hypothetical protein
MERNAGFLKFSLHLPGSTIAKPLKLAAIEESGELRTRSGIYLPTPPEESIESIDLRSRDLHR